MHPTCGIYDLALSNGQGFDADRDRTGAAAEAGQANAHADRAGRAGRRGDRLRWQAGSADRAAEPGSHRHPAAGHAVPRDAQSDRDELNSTHAPGAADPRHHLGRHANVRVWPGRIHDVWTINGQAFDPDRIDAQPRLGTTETWILRNSGATTHLIHIHDVDQQLVSRNGAPPAPYELMKETWNLHANETIVVKLKFTDNTGIFMLHCHILEHEDMAMMTQFQVVP